MLYRKLQSHSDPAVLNAPCLGELAICDDFLHLEAALHFVVIPTAMTAVILTFSLSCQLSELQIANCVFCKFL